MTCVKKLVATIPVLALSCLTLAVSSPTRVLADDAPPTDGPNGRHHNPAWAACKKQADDQKIAAGDAHKQFMKNCMGAAKGSAPAS